jgi:F0F1-type ATP synthase membrane subunit c/vacuolar-type H+-ATPase subunit K
VVLVAMARQAEDSRLAVVVLVVLVDTLVLVVLVVG